MQYGRTQESNDERLCPSLDPGQMGNCECKVGGELGPMMEGVGVGSSTEGK